MQVRSLLAYFTLRNCLVAWMKVEDVENNVKNEVGLAILESSCNKGYLSCTLCCVCVFCCCCWFCFLLLFLRRYILTNLQRCIITYIGVKTISWSMNEFSFVTLDQVRKSTQNMLIFCCSTLGNVFKTFVLLVIFFSCLPSFSVLMSVLFCMYFHLYINK